MSQTFGPYSPVRRAGDWYFVSGQVGVDLNNGRASSDVESQTKQALNNVEQLLELQGLTMDNIVKTTIYVTDMDDFAVVNEVYGTYFKTPRPARSTVQVAALPKVAGDTVLLVEIEAVAYKEAA